MEDETRQWKLMPRFDTVSGKGKTDKAREKVHYEVTLTFDEFSQIEELLPHLKNASYSHSALSKLMKESLSRVRETVEMYQRSDMVLPFTCEQLLILISVKPDNYESGISNAYDKVLLVYEHLKKAKNDGAKLAPVTRLIPVERFSKEKRNVELSFKIIELFDPSDEQYRYFQVLRPSPSRDPEITKMVNDFLDSKRSRDDIIMRPRNYTNLTVPETDSDSSDGEASPVRKSDKSPDHRHHRFNSGPRNYNQRPYKNHASKAQSNRAEIKTHKVKPKRPDHVVEDDSD